MSGGLYTAVSGIRANQTSLNVIANNLANVNTVAFKSSSVNFQTLFANSLNKGTPPSTTLGGTNPLQIGTGVKVADISVNFAQGGSQFTGRATDLSITGNGFFTLAIPGTTDGSYLLTRAGNFQLDADGNLSSASGNPVVGTRTIAGDNPLLTANINVPRKLVIWKELDATTQDVVQTWIGSAESTSITSADMAATADTFVTATVELVDFAVGGDGAITATYSNGDRITVQHDAAGIFRQIRHITSSGVSLSDDGSNADGSTEIVDGPILLPEQIQIRLAKVTNPEGLLYAGTNNYSLGVNSGDISMGIAANGSRGAIESGSLESSNVDIAQTFTNMIVAQRGLEAASKAVTVQSDVLRTIIGII